VQWSRFGTRVFQCAHCGMCGRVAMPSDGWNGVFHVTFRAIETDPVQSFTEFVVAGRTTT